MNANNPILLRVFMILVLIHCLFITLKSQRLEARIRTMEHQLAHLRDARIEKIALAP
jgi:hypothetical protein